MLQDNSSRIECQRHHLQTNQIHDDLLQVLRKEASASPFFPIIKN